LLSYLTGNGKIPVNSTADGDFASVTREFAIEIN